MPTPMMTQYRKLKNEHYDCILMYRLGDFYEMYYDDAVTAANVLDLTLTSRSNKVERIPMCGIPYHALDNYVTRLVAQGYKVAICEQLAEKGVIAAREVVKVVTAGTLTNAEGLSAKNNNYICCIAPQGRHIGVAFCDVCVGTLDCYTLKENSINALNELLYAYQPSEIIGSTYSLFLNDDLAAINSGDLPRISPYLDWAFNYEFAVQALLKQYKAPTLNVLGLQDERMAVVACGAMLRYLTDALKLKLDNLQSVNFKSKAKFLSLDYYTRKNLELTHALRDGKRKGSLFNILDKTSTPFGGRLLGSWFDFPLQDKQAIERRLDAVGELTLHNNFSLKDTLLKMGDVERALGRIAHNAYTTDDLWIVKSFILLSQTVYAELHGLTAQALIDIKNNVLCCSKITLLNALREKDEQGVFAEGFDENLDKAVALLHKAEKEIINYAKELRTACNIKGLKIASNKVFGLYIEVPNTFKHLVPQHFIPKQTLTNGQRYTTAELTQLEIAVTNCQQSVNALTLDLKEQLRLQLMQYLQELQQGVQAVAELDCYMCFAFCATEYNYKRPALMLSGSHLNIIGGRHPVVERQIKSFVPNNTLLDDSCSLMLITGPNMAGKSTYMRQIALICLMAHVGSFVPCVSASIPLLDGIYTRIGAQDDISFNKSTFMVECQEVANILNCATSNSLVLLDEVGRGTSNIDGVAIATAVAEYLSNKIGAKTTLATHFRELTLLENDKIKNFMMVTKHSQGKLQFVYEIKRGIADKSFGIDVAEQSGMPNDVIVRARELMEKNND